MRDCIKESNSLSDILKNHSDSEKIALIYREQMLTFKDWDYRANCLSGVFSILTQGKVVAIFIENSLNYALSYFGILYSNKTVFPIMTKLKDQECLELIIFTNTDLIVSCEKYRSRLSRILINCGFQTTIYFMDSGKYIKIGGKKKSHNSYNNSIDNVAMLLVTSGTTGNAKIVMLTHKNLISNAYSSCLSGEISEEDSTLIYLPMCYGFCNTAQLLSHVLVGGTIVIADTIFNPSSFFFLTEKYKITNFAAVPSMMGLLLHASKYSSIYNLDTLKKCFIGGAFMQENILDELHILYPKIKFFITYGLTECSTRVSSIEFQNGLRKHGSVGKAVKDVEIKISYEGKDCLPFEIGEVLVKGPNVMKGYFNNEAETQKVLINNWFYTGDLGYKDLDGFLFLVGRIKNIIIRNGVNIYPEEVEKIILGNQGVIDVCVCGENDKFEGEVPIAYVKLAPDFTLNELKKYCKEFIAEYKIPCKFVVVGHIEKTLTGKVNRGKIHGYYK